MNLKFSVITCTLNREKFIMQALDSVETQKYPNIEHIIIDGFSTDSTHTILDSYIKRNQNREIKVIKTEPKGIANAMNVGIEYATGDIINFLHDDDLYIDNESLSRVASYFDKNPKCNIISGNWPLKVKDTLLFLPITKITKLSSNFFAKMPNGISHENTFVKKALFEKYGPFDESFKYAMDYEYWQRIVLKEKILFVDDYFTVFISHPESASHNYKHWPVIIKEILEANKKNQIYPIDYLKYKINSLKNSDIIKIIQITPEELYELLKKDL